MGYNAMSRYAMPCLDYDIAVDFAKPVTIHLNQFVSVLHTWSDYLEHNSSHGVLSKTYLKRDC